MLKGILSIEAASRIGHPDLAGAEVEYNILHPGLAGEIYRNGELIARCVEIGPDGIIPKEEMRTDGLRRTL
jgi:hypothetical protein